MMQPQRRKEVLYVQGMHNILYLNGLLRIVVVQVKLPVTLSVKYHNVIDLQRKWSVLVTMLSD